MNPTKQGLPVNRTRTSYREEIYAKYAEVQSPVWLHCDSESKQLLKQRALTSRLRDWLPPNLNAECLDLGCGDGENLMTLQSIGYSNAIGVDKGPQQVALAEKRGLRVVMADLRDYLRACEKTFDVICAFDVIEHFAKDELLDLLDLIWGRLNPGGVLVLQTPNALSPWASHYRYGDLTHELIFSPECMTSTLRLARFETIDIREVRPVVHGVMSAGRWALWQLIRTGCALWTLAEIGSASAGVYTRNMMVRAIKDPNLQS